MVFIFIFATAGLLIWAAIKPWVEKWVDVSILDGMFRIRTPADIWLYRVRENEEAIYQCRVRVIAELEVMDRFSVHKKADVFSIQRWRHGLDAHFGSDYERCITASCLQLSLAARCVGQSIRAFHRY